MILLRHAQSEWNALFGRTRVDPGIEDPPLTELGRAQAKQAAVALADSGLRRIVASPYHRTLETAAILAAELDLPVSVEPLVRERNAFSCDIGSPPERLGRLWPDLDFSRLDPLWYGEPEESEAALAARCAAFERLSRGWPDRPEVAVVSHWGFIRGLTGESVDNATALHVP